MQLSGVVGQLWGAHADCDVCCMHAQTATLQGRPVLRYCLLVEARPGGGTDSQCTANLRSYLYKVGQRSREVGCVYREQVACQVACWYVHSLHNSMVTWEFPISPVLGDQAGETGCLKATEPALSLRALPAHPPDTVDLPRHTMFIAACPATGCWCSTGVWMIASLLASSSVTVHDQRSASRGQVD
jgi:hypothetical protein